MPLVDPTGLVRTHVPLAKLTTSKVGGHAAYFADVRNEDELRAVVAVRDQSGQVPILILGKGSNVIISDAGFDGLVIHLQGEFLAIDRGPDGNVTVGGGVSLPKLARRAAGWGRGGLEWLVGIPGSVGGAVKMNASGYGGGDTAKWLITAEVFDLSNAGSTTRRGSQLGLDYRASNIADADVVVRATFRTVSRSPDESSTLMRDITRWRKDNQPGGTFNAGSVFKNPPLQKAWEIIDDLGLKGFRVGGAFVSHRHANFFEAEGFATAQDIYDLVWSVQERVAAATGILLVPEVRFVGRFDESRRELREEQS